MVKLTVKKSGIVELQTIPGGSRGDLFVGEVWEQIPFPIRRFFFVKDMEYNAIRGGHAHRQSRQAIFCLAGSFLLRLDDGSRHQSLVLPDHPGSGVLIEPILWHELTDFSKDCIVLVVANNRYDERDYVRDYKEFLLLAAGAPKEEIASR